MSSKIFTNQLRKYVRSLHSIKYRQKYNKFIAEGPKVSYEFINQGKYLIEYIFCLSEWYESHLSTLSPELLKCTIIVTSKQLDQISTLKSANQILIVAEQVSEKRSVLENEWLLYLDRIQDPGNMGTILRIADWYNFKQVIASSDSVSFYNPKVIQAGMGAHNRISFLQMDIASFSSLSIPKYAMTLTGNNSFMKRLPNPGAVIIGNESKGVSNSLLESVDDQWSLPRYGGAESLNAAVACGIICYEIKRSH